MPQQKFGKIIQSVQRAIDIINCFDDVATELTLGEISAALDLNKSTVHGILNTLHNNEFIRQNANGKYMLGQALLRKYHFTDSARRALLMEEAKAEMTRIANEYHVNSSIYMLELGELLLVNRILPENEMYTVTCISDSYLNPLYCTASGKILLANLAPAELE
ncbi:MAG: helix-turn-helix domain-containing protein, partial [Pygmaiobacter sp.]